MAFLPAYLGFSQSDKTWAFGPGINGYGVSGCFKIYKAAKENQPLTKGDFLFELGNIQNKREVALINNALQSSGVYKYGKINYAWSFRSYYMARYNLSARQDRKSVSLNAVGGIGIPIAYTWPVHILLYDPARGQGENYEVVRYDPAIHPQIYIGGRAPFTRGLNQGKFTPGMGVNGALEFGWGNYRNDVKLLTLGARFEGYAKKLPVMYEQAGQRLNKSIYSMFYLTFAFGISNH